jgi:hypothetical protein
MGYDKMISEALIGARGQNPNASKIAQLEKKLDTCKLSSAEIAEIQKELKRLKSH